MFATNSEIRDIYFFQYNMMMMQIIDNILIMRYNICFDFFIFWFLMQPLAQTNCYLSNINSKHFLIFYKYDSIKLTEKRRINILSKLHLIHFFYNSNLFDPMFQMVYFFYHDCRIIFHKSANTIDSNFGKGD